MVVLDTTKVQIFKQITTVMIKVYNTGLLFQIPQRYRFSSKSQQITQEAVVIACCFRYHKGTDFQANHNKLMLLQNQLKVVLDTTKVQIFKQITTGLSHTYLHYQLFQIPQRYRFSSKSQRTQTMLTSLLSCFRYHKGTDFYT